MIARYGMRALIVADALALQSVDPNVSRRSLTVSGTIADERGRALEGVIVRLSGASSAMTRTRANGSYAITVHADRSATAPVWSIQATRTGCRFAPSPATVSSDHGAASTSFTGIGAECAGTLPAVTREAAAIDPGPRPGPAGAGGPVLRGGANPNDAARACLPGLAPPMLLLCEQAFIRFQEVDSVSGTLPGEDGAGLGPTFNGNSCAMCHAQPAVLGSSPGIFSPQRPMPNPEVALAVLDGAHNPVPPFVGAEGPVRVARFKSDDDVHDLYTIAGRSDARQCAQKPPDFAAEIARGNVGLRIPLQLFGLGLAESVSESALRANLEASRSADLGIAGMFNISPSDGTISRFGRKGQDKSLLMFASEAYNVEIGVTNELFPEERHAERGCTFNGTPEDRTDPLRTGTSSEVSSDIVNFALAIRLSAPPVPALPPEVTRASVDNGRAVFENIGCANCHTPTLVTATSNVDRALSRLAFHPFSDFALHHMGTGLADGIAQILAGPDQFRTTPLWGLGQRLFFLHDGRTSDLVEAVVAHASPGSEASVVITSFEVLSTTDQQDLVNFLRSL